MKLDSRDIVEILTAVKELGFRRFHARIGELTLEVDTQEEDEGTPRPAADEVAMAPPDRTERAEPPSPMPVHAETERADVASRVPPGEGVVAVTAPMSGIFYRAPAPGAAPFVSVGARVEPGDTVCIVEIMKLFNSIAAGVAGTVVDIPVENEGRVAAGQPVMWIEPGGSGDRGARSRSGNG